MNCFPSVLVLGLVLLGSASCKKNDPEKEGLSYDGVPYYHYTDKDRLWLQAKNDSEWRFDNGLGKQRIYRVSVSQYLKRGDYDYSGGIPGSSKLVGYYDHTTVRVNRIDTLKAGIRGGLDLRFYRDAALLATLSVDGYDNNTSRFYAVGEYYEFVGNTDTRTDYYSCRGMKFPTGASLNGPFQQLAVRGRTYTDVVAFVSTARESTCATPSSSFMQEVYYDRQAGLVRMVSLAGEVWDRVP